MKFTRIAQSICAVAAMMIAGGMPLASAQTETTPTQASGQILYLPIYSHIYHGDQDRSGKPLQTLVSSHVSIRNTDAQRPIRVLYARYYNTEGKLIREFVPSPITIPTLGTHELFVERGDSTGGSGANFMISWQADGPVSAPLVEALHADIKPARTVVFITTARPVSWR